MRPARSVLLALVAAAVALIAVSASRSWIDEELDYGLTIESHESEGVRVARIELGSPAARAGLSAGDRVLSIGGTPVRSQLAARDALSRGEGARPLGVVVLRHGAGPLGLSVVPDVSRELRVERVVASAVALLFLLGASAVLLRPRAGTSVGAYAAFCLAGGLLLGVGWSDQGSGIDWVLYWIDRAARVLFPALWIHLVLAIGRSGVPRLRWAPVAYAPALALLLAEVHVVALGSALRSSDPVGLVDLMQSRVELAWIACGLLVGLGLLARSALRAERAEERAQARFFLVGTTLALAPFLLLSALPRVLTGSEPAWSFLGLPFLALVPLVLTGAVLEYRLMDLALFVRRGIELVAALAFSGVLFIGLHSLARVVVAPLLDPPGMVPLLVAALTTAALAPAIRAGSRTLVGRLYYRHRYSFRRALGRVARDLNAKRDLPELAAALVARVREALDAGPVRLLMVGEGPVLVDPESGHPVRDVLSPTTLARLQDGETVTLAMVADAPRLMPGLHHAGVQVLVPLRVEERLIALLAVGPRQRGRLLDSDDLDLVRSVAAHAAAAVAGAQHLAELRGQVELVQRLQRRTQTLVESSPIGMAVVDRDGRVRHWNRALETVIGVTAEDALGAHYADLLPDSIVPEVHRALVLPAAAGQSARVYQLRIPAGPEGELIVNLTVGPLLSGDDADGVLLTLDDVTERARLEEQLIQQDRLASVGLLAAGVAHEVNTPLTGISSYAQLLLDETASDDPRRPLLEKIVSQAGRASHIARGLLSISRPSQRPGEEQGSIGSVDLRELVDETLGLLGVQVRRADAFVGRELPDEPLVVRADRSRLQQVLMNLLLNAVDAVDRGGTLTVRGGYLGAEAERVFIEVEDDGPGIPESIRDRVFDPFFTTKQPGQGTGLGLSISYSIVKEHGGSLVAESGRAQRGTRMRMELPTRAREAGRMASGGRRSVV